MTAVAEKSSVAADVERVLIGGDLGKLTPEQRVSYYQAVCNSVGLNPMTRPFDYLVLSGKTVLYAKRDATDQLRKIHGVSVKITHRENMDGVYVVTAAATDKDGRSDESTGAVNVGGLKGDPLANALMKAETKAKRRVTLSICGLGILDECEVETIPNARQIDPDAPKAIAPKPEDGEFKDAAVVEEYENHLSECKNKVEAKDLALKVKDDKRLTEAGRAHLRPQFARAIIALPDVGQEHGEAWEGDQALDGADDRIAY